MPELIVPRIACEAASRPLVMGPRVLCAYERLGRQSIVVSAFSVDGNTLVHHAGDDVTLPGAYIPEDRQDRAMWPAIQAIPTSPYWRVPYQRGPSIVASDALDVPLGVGRGMWPVGVDDAGRWLVAPLSTSTGVFGWLDGRWWLFEDIWTSTYQRVIPGRLSHGWRDADGVLHLLSEYGPAEDQSDAQVLYWNDVDQVVRVVMRTGGGHSTPRWPHGAILPDGRLLVLASDLAGYVRAAAGHTYEFPRFQEETTRVAITIHGFTREGVAPMRCGWAYSATDAVSAWKRVRPLGADRWNEEPVPVVASGFAEVTLTEPGEYEIGMWVQSASGAGDETRTPRIVTVRAPELPPFEDITTVDVMDAEDLARQIAAQLQDMAPVPSSAVATYASIRGSREHDETGAIPELRRRLWAAIKESVDVASRQG